MKRETVKRSPQCVYCGATERLTKDHVPPKNIFPTPRPADLITVPACDPCNKSYEKDDEYFRFAITAPVDLGGNPVASRLWKERIVGGTLKRSPALRSTILQSLSRIDVRTPAGLYLGTTPTIRLNRNRLDRIARRIVTALHWHHHGTVPADGINLRVMMGPNPRHPGIAEKVARDLLGGRPWISIGDGTFRYAHDRVPNDPDWGAWLLLLHSSTFFLVMMEGAEGERDSE